MTVEAQDNAVAVDYYDSDYPSTVVNPFPENVDDVTVYQGVRYDVERYLQLAAELADGEILELCCGSGRIAVALARNGFRVCGVDLSAGMLERCAAALERETVEVRRRVRLVRQDITELTLEPRGFGMAICGFNSLLCVADFEAQRRALRSIAARLRVGGTLVLDLANPLDLNLGGNGVPTPFFTRRRVDNGHSYTRFAMSDPLGEGQRQRLHGWYDELDDAGTVTRRPYELWWRPIYRYEIELMLAEAGFAVARIEGGHRGEPFTMDSPHMLIQAELRPVDAGTVQ
ncbi:MAG TPA: class I SAM-dependent methyltransferase [Stackebrandtia sp.]|uniref:class I SAM-dependent methyltransferase n=1 Tax=Stackebrandtia sp. TaxID=2023065 RepID=UPI002D245B96|nr:class I SAM-dependent methyltransferase [Stackebrandtia sp.]HZE37400.1 class I SAM-dependent methyltransferase [Stackebrandtia sp.]